MIWKNEKVEGLGDLHCLGGGGQADMSIQWSGEEELRLCIGPRVRMRDELGHCASRRAQLQAEGQ